MVNTEQSIYQKFVMIENRQMFLYIKLYKAVCRFLRSALLFDEKLVPDLKSRGFIINPYYPCIANIMVNGKHMTMTWHVDDLNMSQVDADEVKKVID